MNLAKVWPLRPGVKGCTHTGERVELQPGVAGFMEHALAIEAEACGDVQLMAGQTPQSLRTPTYETREARVEGPVARSTRQPPRKKKTYVRRDIVAESPDG